MKNRTHICSELFCILIGSILYGLSTILFIFPNKLLLGGTSGISVILESFLPFSPGTILMVINFLLILVAFLLLGRGMAFKTLIGSVLTTLSVGIFEKIFTEYPPILANPYLATIVGAVIIAFASGIMFYVDSSSGGTDIVALIVRKFTHIHIGKSLLITDVVIVLVGGWLSGFTILLCSTLGLLIKTLGIDWMIAGIQKLTAKHGKEGLQ